MRRESPARGRRVELVQQRGEARARDPGTLLKAARGAPRQRSADHRVAARLPRLARDVERIRLAGPGLADHDRDARSVAGQPPHHRGLLGGERGPARDRAFDGTGAGDAGSGVLSVVGVPQDPALELEQLGRRVRPLLGQHAHDPAVAASQDVRPRGPLAHRQHDGAVGAQEAVGEILDVARRHVGAGRQLLAEPLDRLAPRERRAPMRESRRPGEPLGRPLLELGVDRGRPRPVEQTADPLRAQAEAGGALAPLGHELLGRDPVVLAPARVERGDLRRSGARRAAALELGLDVGAAAAERAERLRRHAGDVRDPVADRAPLDAQLARELGAQPSLVEVAGGLGVRVQPAAVERRPAPIRAEREVGDEHVGVQLRVAGARGAMHERRGDQPSPGDAVDARGSAPRDRGLALDVAERVLNRPVVRGADRSAHAVIADAEQHADALGRRERQIEAWHSRRCLAAERHAIRRVLAGQHALQLLAVDLAAQAEQRCAVADPLAGRLGPGEVVVVDAAGHGAGPGDRPVGLLEVVVGVADGDLSDRKHLRL